MLEKLLKARNLPPLCEREKMMEILQHEEYGYLPGKDVAKVSYGQPIFEKYIAPNGALMTRLDMVVENEHGSHTIPLHYQSMNDGKQHPLFVFLSFESVMPNRIYPGELLAEHGFNILSFCYTEATTDDDDFSNGVAPILLPEGQKQGSDCGKIAMWAWCTMRALDYAETLPDIDKNQVAVIGHSRLGKTALYTGMMDSRFRYVFSNNAGCSGDALSRGNQGESIASIIQQFPYWFCKNYYKYAETNAPDDFDQHYLLATIAPRFVCVSASSKDAWADPVSEQLCCLGASTQWENMGLPGLVHENTVLEAGQTLSEGRIAFSVREGIHFLSYHNWLWNIEYIEKHKNDII